jgi:hypothetical protein
LLQVRLRKQPGEVLAIKASRSKAIGKARNAAVVAHLRSLGVTATFVRENNVSSTNLSTAQKVNRITIHAAWTNPS